MEPRKGDPLVVVEGAGGERVEHAFLIGYGVVALVALGAVTFGPLTGWNVLPALSLKGSVIAVLLPAAVGGGLAELLARPTTGRAEFYPHCIIVTKVGFESKAFGLGTRPISWTTTIAWDQIAGYRDDRPEHVRIVPRRRRLGSWFDLTIPTPTEADRVAVLALLDQKGVPRVE